MKPKNKNYFFVIVCALLALTAVPEHSLAFQHLLRRPKGKGKATTPSQQKPLAKEKTKTPGGFSSFRLLEVLPEPATIVEQKTHEKTGITSAWLSNGVRFHHRFTEEEPGRLTASVAFGGGEIEETEKTKGNTLAASLVCNKGFTSKHSATDIARFMSGKKIRMSISTAYGPFVFELESPTAHFDSALEKIHVLLMDGKIPESAIEAQREAFLRKMGTFRKVVHFQAVGAVNDLISGGDPRRTLATESVLLAQSAKSAQAWFDRIRETGPIEVAVVGDIQLEPALRLVARYIGSLPERPRSAPRLDKLRHINRPTGPLYRKIEFESAIHQSMVLAGFMACDARNSEDRRALQIAALILDKRAKKRLRGQDKLAISVSVKSESMWRYRDSDRFTAVARCKPENAEELGKEIHKLFAEFANKPARKKEFSNANFQWIKYYRSSAYDNTEHWLRILQFHDLHGQDFTEEVDAWKIYKSFTPEKVQAVFKKYYTPQRRHTVCAIPRRAEVIKPKETVNP